VTGHNRATDINEANRATKLYFSAYKENSFREVSAAP